MTAEMSVVVPTKDDPEVFQALESLKSQRTDVEYEVIVVDGSASSDHSRQLRELCEEEDMIFLDEKDFGDIKGLCGARNAGIAEASGSKVALLDGDCIADERWIESLSSALEEHGIVESNVSYEGEGKKCPMDRVIENEREGMQFLGAGLSFRMEVWEDLDGFDSGFRKLRGDTDFGLRALQKGYSYGFADEARISHRAGEFTAVSFLRERERFVEEPKFYRKHRGNDLLQNELSSLGPVLEPKELGFLAAMSLSVAAAAAFPALLPVPAAAAAASLMIYLRREAGKRELEFCPVQLALLLFLVPAALYVKRFSIWRGAVRDGIPVV